MTMNIELYDILDRIKSGKTDIKLHNDEICTGCGNLYMGDDCYCESIDDCIYGLKADLEYFSDITELFEPIVSKCCCCDMDEIIKILVASWFEKNKNLYDIRDEMTACAEIYEYVFIFENEFIPYKIFIKHINNLFAQEYVNILTNKHKN